MKPWVWGVMLYPFVAAVLFGIARLIGNAVLRKLPNGWLRRMLSIRW